MKNATYSFSMWLADMALEAFTGFFAWLGALIGDVFELAHPYEQA